MRRIAWFVLTLIAIAAISILAYEIVTRARQGAATPPQTTPLEGLIVTAEPVMRNVTQQTPWTGVVQSTSTVRLIAQTAGRIETIQATDDAPIQAGAVVMTLGGPLLAAQREKLEASVKSLQAQLALAKQNVKTTQQNVAQHLATRNELATAQEEQLKLENQLRDAQANLDTFGLQTDVIAPISGVFTNRQVNIGQTLKEGDPLGVIIDPNHLRIVASLFVSAQTILQGKEAVVQLGGGQAVSATVRNVLPQASDTGATQVWIEGPQIDKQLRPGQTATGEVITESRISLAVPESAVVYGPQEQPYVFVPEQGRYDRRSVRVGMTQDGWVEILAGLQPGQAVVTKGAYELLHREFSSQYRVED